MKKTLKVVAILLVVLIVGAVIALQVYLKTGLNRTLQSVVAPELSKTLGVTVKIGPASVNLVGGSVNLGETSVANPAGFTEPELVSLRRLKLDVGMTSLLRGALRVSDAEVDGLRVTIVRDRQGRLNSEEIQKTVEKQTGTGTPPPATPPGTPPPDQPPPTPARLPDARLDEMNADALFTYVDYELADPPLKLAFQTRLTAGDIRTVGTPDSAWGEFALTGNLENNPKAFVTALKGTVAPLSDPARPSFDLKGNIASIDLNSLSNLLERMEVTGDSMEFTLALKCRDGRFADPSMITVRLTNARLTGKAARKARGVGPVPEFNVIMPVSGPLTEPVLHWEEGLMAAILGLLKDNAGSLLQGILKKDDGGKKKDGLGGLLKQFTGSSGTP